MGLTPVTLDGTYTRNQKGRFIPLGAHWVSSRGLHWPVQWQPEELRGDFGAMKALGFNTVRIDLFWAWFEPYPGQYNPKAFEQLDEFVHLAHEFEIYLHPCMFIGGETGYYDIPYRHGRHPHADPDMLRLQADHARQIASRYKDEPAILAWDLTDEPPFWIVRAPHTTDAMAINWTRLVAGAVRRADPRHLLCLGTDQEDLRRGPFRPDLIAEEVDFFSSHQYPIYMPSLFPDAMLSVRMTYAGAFQTALSGGAGKPVMIHELGASAAQYLPDTIARYDRTSIYSALAAGANGFLLWDVIDAAAGAWRQAPYKTAPHETQFGLMAHDRAPRPAGETFREIARVLAEMDLDGLEPEPATAAMIVPWEWSKPEGDYSRMGMENPAPGQYLAHHQDNGLVQGLPRRTFSDENLRFMAAQLAAFILLRQSGQKPGLFREYRPWQEARLLVLPSPLTGTECDITHVHTTFWDEARRFVRKGGTLYASTSADAAVPEMEDLFGARLADHRPTGSATLTVVRAFGGLQPGEALHFRGNASEHALWPATLEVTDGQVIAQDESGRPALVVRRHERALAVLCAIPLEAMMGATPAAFDEAHAAWRLYRALSIEAHASAAVRTDSPHVEAGSVLGGGRGYTVLVNHSARDLAVTLSFRRSISRLQRLGNRSSKGSGELSRVNGAWMAEVPAWDGVVVAWEEERSGT